MSEDKNQAIINIIQNLLPSFKKVYDKELAKIPYNINVIDELRADENAHSRIFLKLLQYKDNNTYPFLELFLKSLGGDFANIEVKNPAFSAEKLRIDVLIKDDKYGIIIENKIHGAIDQNEQIKNYIDKLKALRLEDEDIFILYLTRQGGSPNEKSISKAEIEKFGERYREINFKHHILPLLENHLLPTCRFKEENLISALQQYIDHLKGILRLRNNQQAMNEEIEKLITRFIEGNNEPENPNGHKDFLQKLKDTSTNLDELQNSLKTMIYEKSKSHFVELCKVKLKNDFPNNIIIEDNEIIIGVNFEYKGISFYSMIGEDNGNLYYSCRNAELNKNSWKHGDTVHKMLKEIFVNKNVFFHSEGNMDYCSLFLYNIELDGNIQKYVEVFIEYTKLINDKIN